MEKKKEKKKEKKVKVRNHFNISFQKWKAKVHLLKI